MVLILALASPLLAQGWPANFKAWGHLEVESYWVKDQNTFGDTKLNRLVGNKFNDDNKQAIAERYRFFLQWGDEKTVRAIIGFEADSNPWGEPGAPSATGLPGSVGGQAGGPGATNRNHMGSYQTDQTAIELKTAYLEFVIPNTPVTLSAGLQNIAIGGPLGRFWMNNDSVAIIGTLNMAPHTIQAFWWKENKGDLYKDADDDMYGVRYMLKQKMFSIEAWAALELDKRDQIESWSWAQTAATTTTKNFELKQTITLRDWDAKPWWLGVNAPIMFGNWTFDPTLVYMGGKAVDWRHSGDDQKDQDFSAWLADLMITYRLGPGLSFTAEGFYTTGDDTNNEDKVKRFQWPTNSEARNVFGNGKSVFFYSNTDLSYYGYKSLDPGGTWYARANVEYAPIKWLNLGFNYFYIGDSSKGDPDDARSSPVVKNVNSPTGARLDKNKKEIGQELNMIATIKIYENFRYMIGMAYFWPGDVFDQPERTVGGVTIPKHNADNAWSILTNLRIVF